MRANRMTGPVTASVDNAYATLARLKIALPLAQAAVSSSGGSSGTTVVMLIDLTRDLTDRLANSTFKSLDRLDATRRERLLRNIAQDVAYLVGRAHERGQEIDAAKLLEQVQLAQSSIDQVPGARASPFFEETLGAQAQWQLAVARASSRMVESMMLDPAFAREYSRDLLKNLLDRVESAAKAIDTTTTEEHRIVRLSLLTQLAKSHSRLIYGRLISSVTTGGKITHARVIATIDAYHDTLGTAMGALEKPQPAAAAAAAAEESFEQSFSPAI